MALGRYYHSDILKEFIPALWDFLGLHILTLKFDPSRMYPDYIAWGLDAFFHSSVCACMCVCVCVCVCVFVFTFFFFFLELGTKPRALRLLGKHSTTELNPQPLYLLFDIIFYLLLFFETGFLCVALAVLEVTV